MHAQPAPVTGIAGGVPYLAVAPAAVDAATAPVVVAWHLMDPPRTEAAFAAALPFDGLAAWRIYLGLPLSGARLPDGGMDEVARLGYEDAVLKLHGPLVTQAAEEFQGVWQALRDELHLGPGPLAVVGGSDGAAVAALVLVEMAPAAGIEIDAAVLISPVIQLRSTVDALAQIFDVTYPWSAAATTVARRLDFVARADDFAAAGQPAVQLVVGAEDDRDGFVDPAKRLHAALQTRYDDPSRADLVVVPGMGHALADEPGVEPAPQTAHAAVVDRHAVEWLRRHLRGAAWDAA